MQLSDVRALLHELPPKAAISVLETSWLVRCSLLRGGNPETHHMVEVPNQGSVALFSWLRLAMPVAVIGMHCYARFGNLPEHCMARHPICLDLEAPVVPVSAKSYSNTV